MIGELNAGAVPPLAGTGTSTHVVAGSDRSDGAYAVLEIRLPPGARSAAHRHDREDQSLVLLEGELTLVLDGRESTLRPGERAEVPRGVPHRAVAGPAGARVLCVCVPGGYDEIADALQDPQLTPDDLAAIRAAAGIHTIAVRW
jgi:quercetin dioxygenase-like cupin family protein